MRSARELIERSWSTWNRSVEDVLRARVDDVVASPGRSTFAASGLAGVMRSYLVGDGGVRSGLRATMIDDVVAACVESLGG